MPLTTRTPTNTASVLVLDDCQEVRETLREFLHEGGFAAHTVSTATQLLDALAAAFYPIVCLDIRLAGDAAVGEVLRRFRLWFPTVLFPHAEVCADWGLDDRDEVTGPYLLPMVKAIHPCSGVLMVTSHWRGATDEAYLRKWGSHATLQKAAPDREFASRRRVRGLDGELLGFCRDILAEERS